MLNAKRSVLGHILEITTVNCLLFILFADFKVFCVNEKKKLKVIEKSKKNVCQLTIKKIIKMIIIIINKRWCEKLNCYFIYWKILKGSFYFD